MPSPRLYSPDIKMTATARERGTVGQLCTDALVVALLGHAVLEFTPETVA